MNSCGEKRDLKGVLNLRNEEVWEGNALGSEMWIKVGWREGPFEARRDHGGSVGTVREEDYADYVARVQGGDVKTGRGGEMALAMWTAAVDDHPLPTSLAESATRL